MLTLKDVRANMIHGYGPVGEVARESLVEVVLLLATPKYIAKPNKGGTSFKIDRQLHLEQFRFVASPEELRDAAKKFVALASVLEEEFAQVTSGKVVSAKTADPQSSFLDESEPKSDSATNSGVSNGQS